MLDSQSVKTTEAGGPRGDDVGKKVQGRKRHLPVDTMGLVLAVSVTPADIQDRDGANAGQLVDWVAGFAVELEIVKRSDDVTGFQVIPKRWIVERTLGRLNRCRRLSKDDEATIRSALAMIRLAMIHVMVRRLAPVIAYSTSSEGALAPDFKFPEIAGYAVWRG